MEKWEFVWREIVGTRKSFDQNIRVLEVFLELYKLCNGIFRNLHFELLNILISRFLPTFPLKFLFFDPFLLSPFLLLVKKSETKSLPRSDIKITFTLTIPLLLHIRAINAERKFDENK